jgi:hypothetical protein
MSESEKDNCRVENDVIGGGEDEVTKFSTKPKKRTHAIKKKNNTICPTPAIL